MHTDTAVVHHLSTVNCSKGLICLYIMLAVQYLYENVSHFVLDASLHWDNRVIGWPLACKDVPIPCLICIGLWLSLILSQIDKSSNCFAINHLLHTHLCILTECVSFKILTLSLSNLLCFCYADFYKRTLNDYVKTNSTYLVHVGYFFVIVTSNYSHWIGHYSD